MAHTKTPWVYNPSNNSIESEIEWFIEPDESQDEEGMKRSVFCMVGAMGGEDCQADIEMICKSVNSHEKLTHNQSLLSEANLRMLDALKTIRDCYDNVEDLAGVVARKAYDEANSILSNLITI